MVCGRGMPNPGRCDAHVALRVMRGALYFGCYFMRFAALLPVVWLECFGAC